MAFNPPLRIAPVVALPDPNRVARAPQDPPQVSWLSRSVTIVYSAGFVVADFFSRLFSTVDGLDKFLKFIGGILLGVAICFRTDPTPILDLLRGRIKSINDTIAGLCNLPSRVADFTKRDADGNIEIFSRFFKLVSRSILVITNVCDTLLMFKDWGANFEKASAAIGKIPVCGKFLVNVGLKRVQTVTAFASFSFAVVHWGLTLAGYYDVAGQTPEDKWKAALSAGADAGKIGLIWFSAQFFCYPFAGLILMTNASAIAKIMYDSYSNNPLAIPNVAATIDEIVGRMRFL